MASSWFKLYPDRLASEILAAPTASAFLQRMKRLALALKREREEESITYAFDSNVLQGVSFGGSKGAKGSKGGKM